MSRPAVSLIAAVARNGAIGRDNTLPWRLPSDLRRFKRLTLGKPLIVGRKTFESIGKPLPGREMIVVTRNPEWSASGVATALSLDLALALASGADEIMIGGGAEIYAQAIGWASRLYITEVDLAPDADARFPDIDPQVWRELRREVGEREARDEAGFTFVDYERCV